MNALSQSGIRHALSIKKSNSKNADVNKILNLLKYLLLDIESMVSISRSNVLPFVTANFLVKQTFSISLVSAQRSLRQQAIIRL